MCTPNLSVKLASSLMQGLFLPIPLMFQVRSLRVGWRETCVGGVASGGGVCVGSWTGLSSCLDVSAICVSGLEGGLEVKNWVIAFCLWVSLFLVALLPFGSVTFSVVFLRVACLFAIGGGFCLCCVVRAGCAG